MPKPPDKFQELLKELFQFDCADLDFGIYRILNQKRAARDFVAKHEHAAGAEAIFVNTDSFIQGARSLNPVFKKRKFNEE